MTAIDKLVEVIASGKCKEICCLIGAGVSTSSGIPDFRSPGGMYDTLRPELLTATDAQKSMMKNDPTAVVSWDLFRENPFCYLEVRRPFILGTGQKRWSMTLWHAFLGMLDHKGMLKRVYSQNIDGLAHQAIESDDENNKIISVHGSLNEAICEYCSHVYPFDEFVYQVKSQIKDIYGIDKDSPTESSSIICPNCSKDGIKPSTVLYGRDLPALFFEKLKKDFDYCNDKKSCDLLLIAGTSLTVYPANGIVPACTKLDVPRFLINKEKVGQNVGFDFEKPRDSFIEGNTDEVALQLLQKLNWIEEVRQRYGGKLASNSLKLLQHDK